jgi:hypothetical protein
VRWCASASAASRSRWRQPVRPPMIGAKPPSGLRPLQTPAPPQPDTRRRGATIARQNPQIHGDRKTSPQAAPLQRHKPLCRSHRYHQNLDCSLVSHQLCEKCALARRIVLPSALSIASAPRKFQFSRLNGWPVRSPADASPASSRRQAHGSGPTWIASPSSQRTFTTYSLPVLRRT